MNLILKKFLNDPLNVGAIIESSNTSAKKIGELINKKDTKNIIEIGGGTGQLSKYILNKNLTIIERDIELSEHLKKKYKNNEIINDCGIKFLKNFKSKYGLLTSIPLIKKDTRTDLVNIINQHIENNQIEWFIILGYKYFNSFSDISFKNHKRSLVLRNVPPAFIWHYY